MLARRTLHHPVLGQGTLRSSSTSSSISIASRPSTSRLISRRSSPPLDHSSSYPARHLHFRFSRPLNPTISRPNANAAMSSADAAALVESAKRKAAQRAIAEHFRPEMRFVGIGSGSTIVYGVEAIRDILAARPKRDEERQPWFVPTGWNSRKVIEGAGLNCIAFDSLPAHARLEVAFDGADEVDDELNCIKGGGACLFQEKLVARRADKFVCIADYRKDKNRLLTSWPTIPIEVAPIAHQVVAAELRLLGSPDPKLRENAVVKAGPIQTDQSFYIIDAPFPQLLTDGDVANAMDGSGKDGVWHVATLAARIKAIVGVLDVGIFCGPNGIDAKAAGIAGGEKPIAVYFGMADGSVKVRTAGGAA